MNMVRFKKMSDLLLAAVLCFSLSACGSFDTDKAGAGDDWRNSGVVAGSGTITHTNEGSVDVLVTVSPESAAFYRDKAEQILFDSVSFPMTIPDAEQAFNAISFDDMDGDGESDVLVSFIHENGDETELIWLWDSEERYVFREDLSTVTVVGDQSGSVNDGTLLPADVTISAVFRFLLAEIRKKEPGTAHILFADILYHGLHAFMPCFFQHLVALRGKLHVAQGEMLAMESQHVGDISRDICDNVFHRKLVQCLPQLRNAHSAFSCHIGIH